jgi:hypothetical protein
MKTLPLPAALATLALLLGAAVPSHAEETAVASVLAPAAQPEWRFKVMPYAWTTSTGVDARMNDEQVVAADIPFSDLIEDLDTILQIRGEAQRGSLGFALDLFDVSLSDRTTGVALPPAAGAGEASLDSDLGMTILDVATFIDPQGDQQGLSFLGGVRLIDERATFTARVSPSESPTLVKTYETKETHVDALAGLRYVKRLTRHLSTRMQADVSTGGTDLTWSVNPSLNYLFGSDGRYAISAGYRRMDVDFEDQGPLDSTMKLTGLVFGLGTSF